MSIDHCDNFSIYGGNPGYMTNGVYADLGESTQLTVDPDGISPGTVLHYDGGVRNGFNNNLRYIYSQSQNIAGKVLRQWLSNIPGASDVFPIFCSWRDVANFNILDISTNPVGGFLVRNYVAAENYSTVGPVITANAWWHIEVKINISAGSLEIRVEGRTVLMVTGKNFGILPVAQEAFATQNNNRTWGGAAYAKDLVYWDGSGTQNINFLGSVIVESIIPNADVALNWTPTPAITGSAILATAPPQDGVRYIDAPHIPAPAGPFKCSMTSLTGDITSIKCVMTMVRAAKTDGGDGSLQNGLISSPGAGPVTTLGADRPITTGQTYWRDVFEIDPKTAAPWLPSSVNTCNLQINRTT